MADPNAAVARVVEERIANGLDTGIQVVAYLHGEKIVDVAAGIADETTGEKVRPDTLFTAMSATKAVAAVALHIQAERGLVEYDAPIARYWPEFGAHGKDKGTVYDVLTHRLGIPQMPHGVTPELMCDWNWMCDRLAEMVPLFEPGTRTAMLSYTIGWVIGEVVRRTDPKKRSFGDFIQDEICKPLGIDSLWLGIPDEVELRVARFTRVKAAYMRYLPPGVIISLAMPHAVAPGSDIWHRPDIRRACMPGVAGIMNADGLARVYAMLACGGQLGDTRLLSESRLDMLLAPRPPVEYDYTLGAPHSGTLGSFHARARSADDRGNIAMLPAGLRPRVYGQPGFGGQLGWADPDARLGVAILRNQPNAMEDRPNIAIGEAIRTSLGIGG